MRVLHLITSLDVGGAQSVLHRLLERLPAQDVESQVISLKPLGPMAPMIARLGIQVGSLDILSLVGAIRKLIGLAVRTRRHPPDVIQTWLYHGDLAGAVITTFGARVPLVWNLRQSALDPERMKATTLATARLCARLSRRIPARIVCASNAGRRSHVELGYDPAKITVIPNGFDLDRFRPCREARKTVRTELGLAPEVPLLGLVGRFDPQKDLRTFLSAAVLIRERQPQARFVLCGEGMDPNNPLLSRWISDAALRTSIYLLGLRLDPWAVLAALDIAVSSSSFGEGFPNVVAEAMACGVPCVATDVGDAAEIVGDTGSVVPPGEPERLASACAALLERGPEYRHSKGLAARRRIESHYPLDALVHRYYTLWQAVALGRGSSSQ